MAELRGEFADEFGARAEFAGPMDPGQAIGASRSKKSLHGISSEPAQLPNRRL
jgi:hypothetical protein